MSNLEDKTVIITGAAGNLGRAAARAFANQGAKLALIGRNQAALEKTVAELSLGPEANAIAADLLCAADVSRMVDRVMTLYRGIDALVNIAGGFSMGPAVHELRDAEWDSMMDLNARTVLNCARAVVPRLLAAGSGRIVNVSARAALSGAARMAPYCASKAAVITLTESLADELKDRGITVNCILPGTLDTPENRAAMPDQDHSRWVPLDAMADVIVFLTSDAARAITGAAIPVYGRS